MARDEPKSPVTSGPYVFHVGKFDESRFAVPHPYAGHSHGFERCVLVDRSIGSVHMGVGICRLTPQGEVKGCIHAYEKGIYVLAGEVEMKVGSDALHLAADDYVFVPYAMIHSFRNRGSKPARWFEMQAPQPKLPGGWQDTFFVDDSDWPARVSPPDLSDPRTRFIGHFNGQRPMIRDASGIRGLRVYRFMEREFGAQHFFMMRGELAVGGVRGRHDHAVEEIYFALSGESDIEIEGKRFHLGAGDFAWTGVGTCHAFFQTGDAPFRWIETQAPQFPAQNASRNYAAWEKLRASAESRN